MKILAIRGRNLASLEGNFELDFTKPPLANAGLFAICGPTGSGKSTLLDALCLALYNETPRLSVAGQREGKVPDNGGTELTQQNPQNLLRRGASEGFAEVDFRAQDGHDYRSCWSVRRARGRPDGRLQNIQMTLSRVEATEPFATLTTDVLERVKNLIGLHFGQFVRAVLLAQNEFSAFLRADGDERAQLLETLTGTEIYSELSKLAYQRAKTEVDRVKELLNALGGTTPLTAEERAGLDQRLEQASTEVLRLTHSEEAVQRHLRWLAALRQKETQLAEALADEEAAHAQLRAAEPRRAQLERLVSVQPARPLAQAVARCTKAAADADEQAHAAAAQTRAAATSEAQARAASAKAQALVLAALAGRTAGQPDLERARSLDTTLEGLIPLHAAASLASHTDREALEQSAAQELRLTTLRGALETELAQLQAWLAKNESLQPLAEQWPRWEKQLVDAQSLHETLASKSTAAQALTSQLDALRGRCATHDSTVATSAQAVAAADGGRREAEASEASFDAAALAAARQAADAERESLQRAQHCWARLDEATGLHAQLEARRASFEAQRAAAATDLAQANARAKGLQAAAEQATRMLRLAEAAAGQTAADLRKTLVDGEPCPVCGACEHPSGVADARLGELLGAQEAEAKRLQHEERANALAATRADTVLAGATAGLEKAHTELAAGNLRLADLRTEWTNLPFACSFQTLLSPEIVAALARAQDELRARLQSLADSERSMRDAQAAAQKARGEWERLTREHARHLENADKSRGDLARLEKTSELSAADLATAKLRLEELLTGLDTPLGGAAWRQAWSPSATSYRARLGEQAAQWTTTRARSESLKAERTTTGLLQDAQGRAVATARQQASLSAQAFSELDARLRLHRAERSALLGGRSADEESQRLEHAVAQAQSAATKAQDTATTAAVELARHQETSRLAGERAAEYARDAEAARTALAQWLAVWSGDPANAVALDEATLASWLSHDEAWHAAEAASLRTLEDERTRTTAVTTAARQQRTELASTRERPETEEEATAQARTLGAETQACNDARLEVQLRLREDASRATQHADLTAQLERQQAVADQWSRLDDVIGAADGARFRKYAQQLTLDVLLAHANLHLVDLARRYRLERRRDDFALLIVDQDMADERRSVHSLSGGESFLVSLALALGLASLSAQRVSVESLFIDEGFGSLDGETLRAAMDALDKLQALGRKVGVISHIAELTERIPTQIRVERRGLGASRVVVVGG